MDVRLFKLINGQELVAELVKPTSLGYLVKSPLVAQIVSGEGGKPTLAFYEYSLFTDDECQYELFNHTLQFAPVDPTEDIKRSYVAQHSKIILPPASSGQILHS
jgi:hypothetical protein